MHKKSAEELLRRGLGLLGISFDDDQVRAFLVYLAELKKWNRAYSLTALKTDSEIVIKHFLDSLLFLKVLPSHVRSLADIGSGAGFPGLPMKIMRPDIQVVLVEPVQKKALFLEHMQRTLKISGLEVVQSRIEDVQDRRFDAIVTRALFSVADFISRAERLLAGDGVLILSKGPRLGVELKDIGRVSMRSEEIILPFENSVRHLVIVRAKAGL